MSCVSLKLKHDIHYMFQNLWSGNGAVLGYVAYDYDRGVGLLGKPEKGNGTLLHLGNASGRRFHSRGENGLDGIYDHQLRLYGLCLV